MTDHEMTRLCAEAMGYKIVYPKDDSMPVCVESQRGAGLYNPLGDDSQALALVKKFEMQIWPDHERRLGNAKLLGWTAFIAKHGTASNLELNRAIVECVAKMQASPQRDSSR